MEERKISRQCTYPGCRVLVTGKTSRCPAHPEKKWQKHGPQVKRITGDKLRKLRKKLFRDQPLCVYCLRDGKTSLATQRDHINPLGEGGTDTEDNVQPLCQACHDLKSKAERERGQKR